MPQTRTSSAAIRAQPAQCARRMPLPRGAAAAGARRTRTRARRRSACTTVSRACRRARPCSTSMASDIAAGRADRRRQHRDAAPRVLRRDAEELRDAVDQPRPDGVRAAQRLRRDRHRHGPRRRGLRPRALRRHPLRRSQRLRRAGYSPSSNDHYAALETQGVNLKDNLVQTTQSAASGLPAAATAGVMTTRAAAQAFFVAGTNRAMFRFTLMNHLCTDLEQVQDTTRPPDRIRQDVSRSPGGDSRVFLNNCIACHSGMDPMTQAFAYYDYDETAGRLLYTPGVVQPKYFNNKDTFPAGLLDAGRRLGQLLAQGPQLAARLGRRAARHGHGRQVARPRAGAQRRVRLLPGGEGLQERLLPRPSDAQDRARVQAMTDELQGERLPAEARVRRSRHLLHGRLRSRHMEPTASSVSSRAPCAGRRLLRARCSCACGGGAETTENPVTSGGPPPTYTGPAPATADVQAFKINVWDNLKANNRCGQCHDAGGQAPQFVRQDDVNLAYAAANRIVNLASPRDSRMVQKVAGGHNCWLASNEACADILTTWITPGPARPPAAARRASCSRRRRSWIRARARASRRRRHCSRPPCTRCVEQYCSRCHVVDGGRRAVAVLRLERRRRGVRRGEDQDQPRPAGAVAPGRAPAPGVPQLLERLRGERRRDGGRDPGVREPGAGDAGRRLAGVLEGAAAVRRHRRERRQPLQRPT